MVKKSINHHIIIATGVKHFLFLYGSMHSMQGAVGKVAAPLVVVLGAVVVEVEVAATAVVAV